jgi:hypothetical protein
MGFFVLLADAQDLDLSQRLTGDVQRQTLGVDNTSIM